MGILRSYFLFSWLGFFSLIKIFEDQSSPLAFNLLPTALHFLISGFFHIFSSPEPKAQIRLPDTFYPAQSVCMSVSKFHDLFPKTTTSISTKQGYIIANYSWVSGFKFKLFKIKRHDPPKRVLVWRRKLKN